MYMYGIESRNCYVATIPRDFPRRMLELTSGRCPECLRWRIFGEQQLDLLEGLDEVERGHVLFVDGVSVALTSPRVDEVLNRHYQGEGRRPMVVPAIVTGKPRALTAWCLPEPFHVRSIRLDVPVESVCSLCGQLRFQNFYVGDVIFVSRERLRPVMQQDAFLRVTEEVKLALQAAKIPGLIFRKYPVVHEARLKHVDGSTVVLR